MSVFLDTSAFLAMLDGDDDNHKRAKERWGELVSVEDGLVSSNYVLVETSALLQNRLGMEAVRAFYEDVMPLLTIEWVDEALHQAGVSGMVAASRRGLSLVDCVSFAVMRRLGVKRAFAFDRHFREQGFECVP